MVLGLQENKIILPLNNINNIKDEIAISKVVQYFENCNIQVPKTTIQNYVREGVVSKLSNNRYYSKQNILEIYFALFLKDVFSLKEIKKINEKIFSFNINYFDIYNIFFDIANNVNIISEEDDIKNEIESFVYKLVKFKLARTEIINLIEN